MPIHHKPFRRYEYDALEATPLSAALIKPCSYMPAISDKLRARATLS